VLQALGTIWFRFLQKKSKKKFHACVPLREMNFCIKAASLWLRAADFRIDAA
jgi:hypothetical protein